MTTDDHEADLVDGLVRSAFEVMGVLTRIGAEHDLSLTQLRVLGIVRDRRPRMSDLAAHLGLDRSSLSGLVDRAERRGLLARVPSVEDRRVVIVEMTGAGRELADTLYAEVRDVLRPAAQRLDAPGRQQLARLLETMLGPTPPASSAPRSSGRAPTDPPDPAAG